MILAAVADDAKQNAKAKIKTVNSLNITYLLQLEKKPNEKLLIGCENLVLKNKAPAVGRFSNGRILLWQKLQKSGAIEAETAHLITFIYT